MVKILQTLQFPIFKISLLLVLLPNLQIISLYCIPPFDDLMEERKSRFHSKSCIPVILPKKSPDKTENAIVRQKIFIRLFSKKFDFYIYYIL